VADAAAVSAWLAFAATDLAALRTARKVSILGAPGDLVSLNGAGRAALRRIEDELTIATLEGRDWLAAETPTIADIAVFPAVALSHDSGIGHEDYPAINLWQRRVRRLPGFVGMPGIPDYF
jgi:glutathione S-transferase